MTRKILAGIAAITVTMAMMLVPSTASAESPTPGQTEATYWLTFNGPDDTFTFNVEKAQGAGILIVDTRDCCIPGDHWKVTIDPSQPASGKKNVVGIGDGNTSTFSGAAEVEFVRGEVTVSYDSGVDIWPAGMEVRFRFVDDNGMGVHITPTGDTAQALSVSGGAGPNAQQ